MCGLLKAVSPHSSGDHDWRSRLTPGDKSLWLLRLKVVWAYRALRLPALLSLRMIAGLITGVAPQKRVPCYPRGG
jgi:hypothetical protein